MAPWRRLNGAILHAGLECAKQRHDLDRGIVDPLAEKVLRATNFRGARQKRQHRARIGAQRGCDRIRHLPFQRRVCFSAEIAGLDGKGTAFAGNNRGVAEQLCDARAVERRRHHENPQILAQAGLRIARQRQSHIRIERAFVKLVEQNRGDAGQFRIVENLPREDALGDDFDPRRARHFGTKANAVADGLADALAQSLRHALGAGAGRDPPRLQHDDFFALRPRRIKQRQRHPCGLAGAGRRHQHGGVAARKRALQFVKYRVDRKGRVESAGQISAPSSPAKAGDPVNAGLNDHKDREYWIPRLCGV